MQGQARQPMHNLWLSPPAGATPSSPVNETFAALGLLNWKPVIGALLLPPVPLLVLVWVAWRLGQRRRWAGGLVLTLALAGLWLSHSQAVGAWLERRLLAPPALSPQQVADLRRSLADRNPVVLVLGGGTQALAPEYGEAHLTPEALTRLHFGLWLARQIQAPVMVSGGAGHAQPNGPAEAAVAARIAARDYNRPLRWQEIHSRDTRENARLSLAMLRTDNITDLLLVTDGWHMARSMRDFEQEAARTGFKARLIAAPMGLAGPQAQPLQQWLPSIDGYQRVHQALHEILGLLAGA